jgi:hypothetical protein
VSSIKCLDSPNSTFDVDCGSFSSTNLINVFNFKNLTASNYLQHTIYDEYFVNCWFKFRYIYLFGF